MSRVMAREEEQEAFNEFRDVYVCRVWELVMICDEHWKAFRHLCPSWSRKKASLHMERDPGGHARIAIEQEFNKLYPDKLDNEDGYSLALSLIFKDLNELKTMLVYRNMGLVYNLTFKYISMGLKLGMEQSDLVQHGHVGLCEGVERFRPEFGYRFSTYGCWWIKHAVTRALHNGALVRLPVHQHSKGMRASPVVSLNAKVSDEANAQTFLEMMEDENDVGAQEQLTLQHDVLEMREQLERLPEKHSDMVRMRFGMLPYKDPHTLREVGDKFKLSRERVRQIVDLTVIPLLRKRMRMAS